LTQEFLAKMVGVHRPRISIIAAMLQDAGLIRYHRGLTTIVDRQSLREAACEDYLITRVMYEHLYAAPEIQRRGNAPGRGPRVPNGGQSQSTPEPIAAQVA